LQDITRSGHRVGRRGDGIIIIMFIIIIMLPIKP
jgi:hypothetical protein